MKLIIDNSNLFAGGGLQVAASFIKDLKKLNLKHEFHIIQSVNSASVIGHEVFPDNFRFYYLSNSEEKSKIRRIKSVRKIEDTIQPNCIFTLFGPSYHKSKFPKLVGFAIPYIIYSDSPFFKQINFKEKIHYKLLSIIKTYSFKKYSDALIFETENARRIFVERKKFYKDTFTVGNTLNEIFLTPNKWVDIENIPTNTHNILFLTANYPHKNMAIVPEIIRLLIEKFSLKDFKFLITLDKSDLNFPEKYNENVEFLGKVDLRKIPSLYEKSEIIFIPTLLEVFSATYLEAMYMRKPIVASDLGFSRDICSDSAYFCNPINAESYADAIYRLISDKNLCNQLVERGIQNLKRFGSSMDRTRKYLSLMENIYENANQK
ncbi:hypothetical protein CO230_02240 [Chryseobacterium sp. 6424]|uniref:glycosyltransferase family 4 protein n=1 Tax=Chryseobacterium sp. 6424 TaxID=2039166 RepID=UPI000EFB21FF|nr:glycosyltransferase family 4 protein [Chryseobacterium sp. 6424]AYO57051.1 hypothetical protein CO230_02240 [Chryseobacterium sp. 6424]